LSLVGFVRDTPPFNDFLYFTRDRLDFVAFLNIAIVLINKEVKQAIEEINRRQENG
jgi:hypothetical protein